MHTIVKSDIANFCYKSVHLKQNLSEFNEIRAYVNYVALNSSEYYNQVLPGESIRRKVNRFNDQQQYLANLSKHFGIKHRNFTS